MIEKVFEGDVKHEFHYDAGYYSLSYPSDIPAWEQEDMLGEILDLVPADDKHHHIKITVQIFDDTEIEVETS